MHYLTLSSTAGLRLCLVVPSDQRLHIHLVFEGSCHTFDKFQLILLARLLEVILIEFYEFRAKWVCITVTFEEFKREFKRHEGKMRSRNNAGPSISKIRASRISLSFSLLAWGSTFSLSTTGNARAKGAGAGAGATGAGAGAGRAAASRAIAAFTPAAMAAVLSGVARAFGGAFLASAGRFLSLPFFLRFLGSGDGAWLTLS
jgi:hypothetical protein